MELEKFGWRPFFASHFAPFAEKGFVAGRVAVEHRKIYRVYSAQGELTAEAAGRLYYQAQGDDELPAVGDWLAMRVRDAEKKATIHAVLPRQSKFSRKAAGKETREQVIAANIDTVFLVSGLDNDFNIRRIERYLTLTWESGALPVIILNKADLCEDLQEKYDAIEAIAVGVPVHIISARDGQGLDELGQYFQNNATVALLGSSGVGKSTLINQLAGGEIQKVQAIRENDGKGRHTTTQREMILLPGGGLIIDTPGLRELQLWDAAEGLEETFDDIEQIARNCFFKDCLHESEPRCAVTRAVAAGTIDSDRFESYKKLQKELRYLDRRQDQRAQLDEKRRWKSIMKEMRRFNKKNQK